MTAPISLEARLDLSAAKGLQETLLPRVDADLCIDAADVVHMGALCTQVLVAASRAVRAGGHRFDMINVSDRVLGQLSAMGMSPESIVEGL